MEKVLAEYNQDWGLRALLPGLWKYRVGVKTKAETKTMTISWKRYERETARKHRGRHIGGSGRPDYLRGDSVGEVKQMQRPMTKPEIIKLHKKGVTEIHSLKGFTEPAMKHVQRYDMKVKLFYRGRRVR